MAPRSWTWTVYLLRPHISFDQALPLDKLARLAESDVAINGRIIGKLYHYQSPKKEPNWLRLFEGFTDPVVQVYSQSNAAVLLVPGETRLFALTFGYGRHLLDPDSYEPDFGLRVTLNSIEADKIKSIDTARLDAIGHQVRALAAQEAPIGDFGLDVERDLVRAVIGVPVDQSLGLRLGGRDSLRATLPSSMELLPGYLERYAERYGSEDYKKDFDWIDQLVPVGRSDAENLDNILLAKLGNQDLERLWLTVPEVIDWMELEGFRYTAGGELVSDLHLRDFLGNVRDPGGMTVDFLRHRRVAAIDSQSGQDIHRWPVYRCLYCEISKNGATYVLSAGKWYRVAQELVESVDRDYQRISDLRLNLPTAAAAEAEREYNERVAKNAPYWACMDRKEIRFRGSAHKIEFCDLFSQGNHLVHVKKYGASSTLSHLFSQGVVSSALWLQDRDFRRQVNKKLPPTHRLQDTDAIPVASRYKVVFAVMSQSEAPLVLPFFSRVSLRNAAQRLRGYRYKVYKTKIQVQ